MYMQNFIEFELIITELFLVLYSLKILTQLVTSQVVLNQQFIFCTFLQITSKLKEIVYNIKRPIGLFFFCSFKQNNKKFHCQYPLTLAFMRLYITGINVWLMCLFQGNLYLGSSKLQNL